MTPPCSAMQIMSLLFQGTVALCFIAMMVGFTAAVMWICWKYIRAAGE